MGIRLQPISASWMTPYALAAQLTAQAGQSRGQGMAALGSGIASGISGLTAKRERESVRAQEEARFQQGRSDARERFNYQIIKDQEDAARELAGAKGLELLMVMDDPAREAVVRRELEQAMTSYQSNRARAEGMIQSSGGGCVGGSCAVSGQVAPAYDSPMAMARSTRFSSGDAPSTIPSAPVAAQADMTSDVDWGNPDAIAARIEALKQRRQMAQDDLEATRSAMGKRGVNPAVVVAATRKKVTLLDSYTRALEVMTLKGAGAMRKQKEESEAREAALRRETPEAAAANERARLGAKAEADAAERQRVNEERMRDPNFLDFAFGKGGADWTDSPAGIEALWKQYEAGGKTAATEAGKDPARIRALDQQRDLAEARTAATAEYRNRMLSIRDRMAKVAEAAEKRKSDPPIDNSKETKERIKNLQDRRDYELQLARAAADRYADEEAETHTKKAEGTQAEIDKLIYAPTEIPAWVDPDLHEEYKALSPTQREELRRSLGK